MVTICHHVHDSFDSCRRTHIGDHIIENTGLPDNLIRGAEGDVPFSDIQIMV